MLLPKMPTPISTTMAIVAISNPYSTTSCPSSARKKTITCRMSRFRLYPRRSEECTAGLRARCRDAACKTLEPGIDVVAENADADEDDDRDGGDQQSVFHDILAVFLAKEATN